MQRIPSGRPDLSCVVYVVRVSVSCPGCTAFHDVCCCLGDSLAVCQCVFGKMGDDGHSGITTNAGLESQRMGRHHLKGRDSTSEKPGLDYLHLPIVTALLTTFQSFPSVKLGWKCICYNFNLRPKLLKFCLPIAANFFQYQTAINS